MQLNMNEITISLTIEQLAVINKGLMFVPFGEAAPVVKAINDQLIKLSPANTQIITE